MSELLLFNWFVLLKTAETGEDMFSGPVLLSKTKGRIEPLKELLKNWTGNCSGCPETPLGDAAAQGKTKAVEVLLDWGVPVDEANRRGLTALTRASQHCSNEAVSLLIKRGADVNDLFFRDDDEKCRTQDRDV